MLRSRARTPRCPPPGPVGAGREHQRDRPAQRCTTRSASASPRRQDRRRQRRPGPTPGPRSAPYVPGDDRRDARQHRHPAQLRPQRSRSGRSSRGQARFRRSRRAVGRRASGRTATATTTARTRKGSSARTRARREKRDSRSSPQPIRHARSANANTRIAPQVMAATPRRRATTSRRPGVRGHCASGDGSSIAISAPSWPASGAPATGATSSVTSTSRRVPNPQRASVSAVLHEVEVESVLLPGFRVRAAGRRRRPIPTPGRRPRSARSPERRRAVRRAAVRCAAARGSAGRDRNPQRSRPSLTIQRNREQPASRDRSRGSGVGDLDRFPDTRHRAPPAANHRTCGRCAAESAPVVHDPSFTSKSRSSPQRCTSSSPGSGDRSPRRPSSRPASGRDG